jgi:hypothetical protein
MKTKRFTSAGAPLLAVAVMVLSATLALAGCGDSGGGSNSSPPGGSGDEDQTITIDFASAGAALSFTLSKGTWEGAAVSAPGDIITAFCAVSDGASSFSGNTATEVAAKTTLTAARINGNKTLTVTIAKKDSNTGSFKIKLRAINAAFASALAANTSLTAEDAGAAGANLATGTNNPVTITINGDGSVGGVETITIDCAPAGANQVSFTLSKGTWNTIINAPVVIATCDHTNATGDFAADPTVLAVRNGTTNNRRPK